jgi:CII-binding regulator of phage lambda lysogenization HflD
MFNESLALIPGETPRVELKSYNVTIPMASLSIGVDNIHHDVFLSPKFVQAARDFLFDLIRQQTKATYFPGIELRTTRGPDNAAFRKLLIDLLQSALTQAKYHKNIEMDLLFRLTLLKFLIAEMGNQFSNLILEGKEWIRQRGEHFERSQQAHVIKARLSELQSVRRTVIRIVGQHVAQMLADVDENVIAKTRRALFGDDFAPFYDLMKNRIVFLDGGKDDFYFLNHYVLLGNYARDLDRFEAMDVIFRELLRKAGLTIEPEPAHAEAKKEYESLLEQAASTREDIVNLEEQANNLRKKLERGEGFITKFLTSGDPADQKASLTDIESRLKHQEGKLEQLGPKIDGAKQKLDFWDKKFESHLGDYLNNSDTAKVLFDATGTPGAEGQARARHLSQLVNRLEEQELLFPALAGYEIRSLAADYSPPVHLQQLRKAVVSKDELKRVAQVLKHVPARKLSLKPIEELAKKIHRYSREEISALVLRFAVDFLHLRRDLRDAEHLMACMERIHLVTTEQVRELSRLNNRLYECVMQEEAKPKQDHVVSHVIIKADVRGSTQMTQDLLARGLSPASHFSLNLHEPVKKLLDRFAAKKVFIEGDAIVLAIFETEATRTYARAVAKACILARQILAVCSSFNERSAANDLPTIELGIGVAYQGSAPTYWIDGDSRIMISKALNLSDRLSGCGKLAKRMLASQKSDFSLFQFLTALEGASPEELDEFLVRYNMNGIELNDEGFEKLSEEISLDSIETKLDMPWGKETVTLFFGEVPMGESVELLVLRKGHARHLLPDGKIGVVSSHPYYEICTNPGLYELVAALIRSQQTAAVGEAGAPAQA